MVSNPAHLFTKSVTLGRPFNFFLPHFLYLQNEGEDGTHHTGLS